MTEHLFLSASINGTGWAPASARWPGTSPDRYLNPQHYLDAARIAHRGVLDAVFLTDHPALWRSAVNGPQHTFDPIVMFSAIAGAVPDIGLLLTASTTYNSPYNLARRLATLDAFSGGRLIWNAVSSFNPDVAANFGADPVPPRDERYRRAAEFLDVVKKLWASWNPPRGNDIPEDALWPASAAQPIDHDGEFYTVRGPLQVPGGPQGHPVIAQAGASDAGLEFAARHAELVYAPLPCLETVRRRAQQLRDRAVAHGRDPRGIRLLPGLGVVIAPTREEAYRRHEALRGAGGEDELIRAFLTGGFGIDPRLPDGVGPDDPLDPDWFPVITDEKVFGTVGHSRALGELLATEPLTLRQLVRRTDGSHRLLVGTPREVADGILEWWDTGLIAGFNLQLPVVPDDLATFVDEVMPILRAEGVSPTSYDGRTVRERLGLPDPGAYTGAAFGTGAIGTLSSAGRTG